MVHTQVGSVGAVVTAGDQALQEVDGLPDVVALKHLGGKGGQRLPFGLQNLGDGNLRS